MKVDRALFRLTEDQKARFVLLDASPLGWDHDWPVIEIQAIVSTAGDVRNIRLLCQATNDEPMAAFCTAPTLRDCDVPPEGLSETLRAVLDERDAVIRMMKEGQRPPFTIKWYWAAPFDETSD
jgi:hypothetical protein